MNFPSGPATIPQFASPVRELDSSGSRAHLRDYVLLAALTIASLLPFCSKPFHMDDPLFLWAARQIVDHPFDPYAFPVNWYRTATPMWKETKNPPLGCYYVAASAEIVGWSERALHSAFLIPALAVILGTYRLARRFTRFPLLAATATLFTPGFLVTANSIMCDVLTLAFWIWAAIFWLEGFESRRSSYLFSSVILITFAAMTKYFGVMLVPLLAVYSYQKEKRWGGWAWYLLCPVLALAGFDIWSKLHYGQALVSAASSFSRTIHRHRHGSLIGQLLVGLSFAGGCTIPVAVWLVSSWSRRWILAGVASAALGAIALCSHWLTLDANSALPNFSQHYISIAIQLSLCILGGMAVLALPFADIGIGWNAKRVMLTLWMLGTYVFAARLNWVTNARSILPLIPALGILLACRVERLTQAHPRWLPTKLAVGLGLAAIVTFWVAAADTELALSARRASEIVRDKTSRQNASVWFSGHSGFQYYMQAWGAKPIDFVAPEIQAGDFIVIPQTGAPFFDMRKELVGSREEILLPMNSGLSTSLTALGADFYAGGGPLPFVVASVPSQEYEVLRLASP